MRYTNPAGLPFVPDNRLDYSFLLQDAFATAAFVCVLVAVWVAWRITHDK